MNALEPRGAVIALDALLRCQLMAQQLSLSSVRAHHRQTGARKSLLQGRGMDFDEVRPYQTGDDIRSMDWRVTARTGKPHTKLFKEEKEQPIFIVIDLRQSMFFGSINCFKSVLAAQCAALFAWSALHEGNRVGGLIIRDSELVEIPPRRSRHSVLALLDAMIRTRPQTESRTGWQQASEHLQLLVKQQAGIWMISDFHDLQLPDLQRLPSRQRLAVQVNDPLELALPEAGALNIQHRGQVHTVQVDKITAARYTEQQSLQQQRIADIFQADNTPRLTLSTDSSLLRDLSQFIARGRYGQ